MEEGVFLGWHRRDCESVRAGDSLFTLEGEKAAQEVEADQDGILWIDPTGPKPGAVVTVGAVIGGLLRPGESPPSTNLDPVAHHAEAHSLGGTGGSPASAPGRSQNTGGQAASATQSA